MYDHNVYLAVPVQHVEIAKRISRALDPDVGGYDAFAVPEEPSDIISYSSPCTAEFAQNVAQLLARPKVLFKVVQADYTRRWGGLVAPTLAEVQVFCDVVQCYVDGTPDELAVGYGVQDVPHDVQQEVQDEVL